MCILYRTIGISRRYPYHTLSNVGIISDQKLNTIMAIKNIINIGYFVWAKDALRALRNIKYVHHIAECIMQNFLFYSYPPNYSYDCIYTFVLTHVFWNFAAMNVTLFCECWISCTQFLCLLNSIELHANPFYKYNQLRSLSYQHPCINCAINRAIY